MRMLVFDNYQRCPVSLKISSSNLTVRSGEGLGFILDILLNLLLEKDCLAGVAPRLKSMLGKLNRAGSSLDVYWLKLDSEGAVSTADRWRVMKVSGSDRLESIGS